MKESKNFLSVIFTLALTLIANILGGGVVMAASALPDAGTTAGGYGKEFGKTVVPNSNEQAPKGSNQAGDGISTLTAAEDGDPDFLDKAIDKKITKIRPMATPIDNISRYAEAGSIEQMEFKYFSIGTRPVQTTLTSITGGKTAGGSAPTVATVTVGDPSMFTIDDTFRLVGVKAKANYQGVLYTEADKNVPDLVLKVANITASGALECYAVNGFVDTLKQPSLVPTVTGEDIIVVRLGKAAGELDVQTGRFSNLPSATEQYCQNFLMQVEQSTFDKMAAKSVDWNFSDLEEDGIYDMRVGMENSFLFGDMAKIKHPSKENMNTWFTKGIWWQAEKFIPVGTNNEITDEDLVDIAKDLFVGTGSGTKQKIMFCGSDMLAALSKIKSDKFRLKENVEAWNLKFKSWDTDFGEILTIHHELFDLNGMADCALAIDPEYLGKKKFINWTRTVLDLKAAGVRNTEAVVLQEASALYLRYPKAHARMKLN